MYLSKAIYRRAFLLGNICLLSPESHSLIEKWCSLVKIDKESHFLFSGCFSFTQRHLQPLLLYKKALEEREKSQKWVHSFALQALHSLLRGEAHRLTSSAAGAGHLGRSQATGCTPEPAGRALVKPLPIPAYSLRSAGGRVAWALWVSRVPRGLNTPLSELPTFPSEASNR